MPLVSRVLLARLDPGPLRRAALELHRQELALDTILACLPARNHRDPFLALMSASLRAFHRIDRMTGEAG